MNAAAPKQEIATAQPAPSPAVAAAQSESDALISMIERASRDDTVNIDKMRELLAMRKQIVGEANEQAFNDKMALAQSEMRAVAADANNPQTKSKYASYFALDKAVRPIYTKHGFALSFDTADGAPDDYIRVVCFVTCCGHTRKYHVDMPADGKGAKGGDVMTKTHAVGSGMSYGQRYLLKMIFNIAVGDDDDGNAATSKEPVSEEQAMKIRELRESVGADEKKFLVFMSKQAKRELTSISEIPAALFDAAVTALNNFKNKGTSK